MTIPTVRETAPLSPGQERLVVSEFMLPDGNWPAEGVPHRLRPIDTGAILVEGDLNLPALQTAVDALVVRQAVLRTTFRFPDRAAPVMLVAAPDPRPIMFHTLAPLADGQLVQQLRIVASRGPVVPTGGDLFGVQVVRLAERTHVILLQIHHLISDGWSIGVLYRDLSELYNAAVQGREAVLPPLPESFAHMCVGMREERSAARAAPHLHYWRRELHGPWEPMSFSQRCDAPYAGETRVDVERVHLDAEAVAGMRAAGQAADRRGGIAGPMLAALAVVLYAATGTGDVRIGTMISNRGRVHAEDLIGYFVNIAVVRLAADRASTIRDLTAAANATVAAALTHQAVPVQDVIKDLKAHSGLGRTPLCQVTLALNTMRSGSLSLVGADCSDLDIEPVGPRVSATTIEQRWVLEERAGALAGTLTYKTDTFSQATVRGYLTNLDLAVRALADGSRLVLDVVRDLPHPQARL